MSIQIPSRLSTILQKDMRLYWIVLQTISDFEGVLKDELFYFEEYTDHGPKHIQSVIDSANNITSEETISNNILSSFPQMFKGPMHMSIEHTYILCFDIIDIKLL